MISDQLLQMCSSDKYLNESPNLNLTQNMLPLLAINLEN